MPGEAEGGTPGQTPNGAAGPARAAAGPGPHYKWIALSNTTLGVLMATINQSIVLIALPDIFRGIGLNPLSPENTSYLLWMFMGFLVVSAVLVVSFGRLGRHVRPRADVQPGVRDLQRGLDLPDRHLAARHRRGAVADRLADRAGHRRRVPVRQLHRDPDRRLPGQPARYRAGHQLDRGHRRLVPRAAARRRARPDQLAPGLPGLRADRAVRHRVGVLHAPRHRRAQARPDGLVGQHLVRHRAGRDPGRHHLWPAALRRAPDGLDQPVGADRHLRRDRATGGVRLRGDQGRRAAVPAVAVPASAPSSGATSPT